MTNVINIAAAGVRASAAQYDAGAVKAVKAVKAATPDIPSKVNPASVMVDVTASRVAYTASLGTLRTMNKMMMGYLLNIKA
jgi:flagellar basal body rod protein FlgC